MGHDDLCAKLQMALLQQQVKLKPVNNVISTTESRRAVESYDDSRLKFIQSILEDDDPDPKDEKILNEQVLNSKLLRELTKIVSSSSSSSSCSSSSSSPSVSPSSPPRFRPRLGSDPEDLECLLVSMAQAVEAGDASQAYVLAEELTRIISTDEGSPVLRTARYFMNALVARLRGYGAQMCRILAQEVTKKQVLALEINLPSVRAAELFANQTILEACQGAQHIHIVDYGILYGCQWPSLIKALSERVQGPPRKMMITGIELTRLAPVMDEACRTLVAYAKSCGIELHFQPVVNDAWEKAKPRYNIAQDELLVINCKYRLRHLQDGIAVESPRRMFFRNIARLKPALFLMSVGSIDLSSPFFIPRFQAAWRNCHVRTEQFHEMMKIRDPSKVDFMHIMMEKMILNVIACDGPDRTERMASYKTWNSLATKAGFQKVEGSRQALNLAKAVWSGHENLTYAMDEEWLVLGWKNVPLNVMSAWRLLQKPW